ncbi:ATP-binding protein [Morganella morganii subsp. morganii]|uniref:AAA family ATPase n=1 Tax=Morganella morganii TaxID=582 RepID=UPI001BDAE24A|nr:AAA family ATPase [Morganella morganii]MBT0351740.1 ATP-binding protein [Morganella morganii subsp. morganii]
MSTVNIIFGENGEGKTRHLEKIIKYNSSRNIDTLAVCNSISSRFSKKNKVNYKYFGVKNGSLNVSAYMKEYLAKSHFFDKKNKMANVLEYLGFYTEIKLDVKINNKCHGFFNLIDYCYSRAMDYFSVKEKNIEELIMHGISRDVINEYYSLIESSFFFEKNPMLQKNQELNHIKKRNHDPDGMITLDLVGSSFSYNPLERREFLSLFLLSEKYLRILGVISSITVYIKKKGDWFDLRNASSGEQYFLGLMSFLSSNVEAGTMVVIDEPENSLHPKWQKEYITMLLDFTFYYGTEFYIATHSPIIASTDERSARLYKMNNFDVTKENINHKNIEKVFMKYFDILTPENRMLSDLCENILNDCSKKEKSKSESISKIRELIGLSYNEKQKIFLNGVLKIIDEIH